jgi:Kef-type K+ transport system membrane component KefB
MNGIALLLIGAALAHALVRWLRLPSTPMLILAGILLARLELLPAELLQETLVLGLTFLLFTTGIELSPRRARAQRRVAVQVGVLQFVLLGALGTAASLLMGFDLLTALYLGLALTASSTFVVIRLLQRRRQLFEPSGRLVSGVLLLQDVLVILLIPMLIRTPEGLAAVAVGVLGTLALVGLAYVTLRWVTPAIVRLHREEEVLLIGVLAVLFLFIGLADLLAVPLAAGAFLAGIALSPFPMSSVIRGQLSSVSDFFTAIFFLALGALLTPPSLAVIGQAAVLALVVVVATPLLVIAVAERAGFSARPAIESGLLLSQTSEISLVVGLQGLVLGQISQDAFTVLALVTVTTIVLTPFLASPAVVRRLLAWHPVYGAALPAQQHTDHVLLLGCGEGGMPLLETLLTTGQEVVVIDDDPEIIEQLRRGDITCIRGDASDPEVLRTAGAEHAKLISSTIRRPRDNEVLLRLAAGVPVLVRVFEDEDAQWVEKLGGTPILYSDEAARDFSAWFQARPAPAPPTTAPEAR